MSHSFIILLNLSMKKNRRDVTVNVGEEQSAWLKWEIRSFWCKNSLLLQKCLIKFDQHHTSPYRAALFTLTRGKRDDKIKNITNGNNSNHNYIIITKKIKTSLNRRNTITSIIRRYSVTVTTSEVIFLNIVFKNTSPSTYTFLLRK